MSEALRLADAIDPLTRKSLDNLTCASAATELRRLHALNAELVEALRCCRDMVAHPDNLEFIDAALAKVEDRDGP